jgi:hypothetical protein
LCGAAYNNCRRIPLLELNEKEAAVAVPKLANTTVGKVLPQVPSSEEDMAWSAACQVMIPNPGDVRAYLQEHADLAKLLPKVCGRVRQAFGREPELSLEVYRDPEIEDCYLTLYVRLGKYDTAIMERIEAVSVRFHDLLSAVSGHFLLATDLRSPRGPHAV